MPIEIKAKRKVEVDEEGEEIVEEKPFHVRMYKYDECPYCGCEELYYIPEIGCYHCPYCGRDFT